MIKAQKLLAEIANNRPLTEILLALVTMVEQQMPGSLCSILLVNHQDLTFKARVETLADKSFMPEEVGGNILEPFTRPCGQACYLGSQIHVADISNDRRWAQAWSDWALNNKLRSCTSRPIISASGNILGSFSIYFPDEQQAIQDITYHLDLVSLIAALSIERKISEEEESLKIGDQKKINHDLQQALLIRDEFISIASHELKSPIMALKLQNQMLQRKVEAGQEFKSNDAIKLSNIFEGQLQRLQHFVDSILDSSRIESVGISLATSTFDLTHFVDKTISRLEIFSLKSENSLHLEIQDKLQVSWDQFRMEQVLTNLILNAFKYAPATKVSIKIAKNTNDTVVISVHDEGPGIPREHQASIFERFNRGAQNHISNGLGLGLYIVKEIIEAHKGKIELVSEPTKGAEFVLTLPRIYNCV